MRGSEGLQGAVSLQREEQRLVAINRHRDGDVLRYPRCQNKDMKEFVKAKVLCIPAGLFKRIKNCTG
jgi:hypothetical protein